MSFDASASDEPQRDAGASDEAQPHRARALSKRQSRSSARSLSRAGTMSSVVGFISGLFGGGEIEIEGEISDDDDGAVTPRGDAEAPRQTTPFSETGRRRAAAGRARALSFRARSKSSKVDYAASARHAGALAAAAVVQRAARRRGRPEKQRAPAENGGGGGSSFGKRFAAEVALRRCLSMPELCLYGVQPLIGGATDADESFGEPREALGISHARDRHGNRYMNQYLAVAPVGHGAFGEVHLCLDTLTHRPYAVKHIPPSSVGRRFGAAPKSNGDGGGAAEVAADPAHAEIAVMKKLTHDHVVRLHEVLRNADGAVYIVMEFVPGGPLLGAAAASDARARSAACRHSRRATPAATSATAPAASRTCTPSASPTATSSRPTCCSPRTAA